MHLSTGFTVAASNGVTGVGLTSRKLNSSELNSSELNSSELPTYPAAFRTKNIASKFKSSSSIRISTLTFNKKNLLSACSFLRRFSLFATFLRAYVSDHSTKYRRGGINKANHKCLDDVDVFKMPAAHYWQNHLAIMSVYTHHTTPRLLSAASIWSGARKFKACWAYNYTAYQRASERPMCQSRYHRK